MADRFNQLLSNLQQQINKALAEARATQMEPLTRSRNVESRFDMISPGEEQQKPISPASLKLGGAGTGGDVSSAADQPDHRLTEVDGIVLGDEDAHETLLALDTSEVRRGVGAPRAVLQRLEVPGPHIRERLRAVEARLEHADIERDGDAGEERDRT